MKDLLTTADLAHNRSGEPSIAERVEKLESTCRVLERSISIQQTVVNEFQQGSSDYGTAMQIVTSLQETYADRKFEAATLRLLATFGENKIQAAQILNAWIEQVMVQVREQAQPTPEPNGTEIADGNEGGEPSTPSEDDEAVH
jgi:hypothetical protein